MQFPLLKLATALSLATVFLTSCDDEPGQPPVSNVVQLRATLTGAAERPTPNNSMATGSFTGSIDTVSRVLTYTVTYSGFTPIMGHLHRITPNATNFNGGVEIPFSSLTSPISGTATLTTKGRVDSLLNGFYYANLHSAAFPGGEIRGDITPTVSRPVRLAAVMTGAAERPTPNASTATGMFTGSLDRATRVLTYTVTYSGLTPTMGHLHRITMPNGNGGVEVPFPGLTSPITGTATLTTQGRVDSLVNGFYYSNLHTVAFPGGELRGDIRVR
ncbi:MAG: CHRD domain-containing protein [Bacteroidetes bacterium]|nr:CHRD domain-containing protein [Fibrella sp.]